MAEQWVEIDGFPGYAVSSLGRVMNTNTELIKTATPNQAGVYNVLLMADGVQHRRSVALLVAKAFLEPPPRPVFDTPINLDGDRKNNAVDNLVWRPRWFAVSYNRQFKTPVPYDFKNGVRCIDTNRVYDHVRVCAVENGLLMKEIILGIWNQTPVFPTWQMFEEVL